MIFFAPVMSIAARRGRALRSMLMLEGCSLGERSLLLCWVVGRWEGGAGWMRTRVQTTSPFMPSPSIQRDLHRFLRESDDGYPTHDLPVLVQSLSHRLAYNMMPPSVGCFFDHKSHRSSISVSKPAIHLRGLQDDAERMYSRAVGIHVPA